MLQLHRSPRADYLAEALGDVLSQPLADAMAREVIAVPTRGVERWLSQRLAHRLGSSAGLGDGICANFDWPSPGALVSAATATAIASRRGQGQSRPSSGDAEREPGPEPSTGAPWWANAGEDAWQPDALAWALVDVIDEHLDEPVMAPLAAHLESASPKRPDFPPRRLATARRLARVLNAYAVYRPDLLLGWADREGVAPAPATQALAPDGPGAAWQAQLYRWLCQRTGEGGPAERLALAVELIESEPGLLAPLPERLACFGLTSLPATQLRVWRAVGAHRDVHLFLLHPSGVLWDQVSAYCRSRPRGPQARALDGSAELAQNPLLRSWGRDAREMQLVLAAQCNGDGHHIAVEEGPQKGPATKGRATKAPATEETSQTLLARLQADIRADREPPGAPPAGQEDHRLLLQTGDRSLQVHSCHGRARQVEVMREAVLHLLQIDASLEPRDVIVMCPDIETFAPLVRSTFAGATLGGGPQLTAKLADRSLRQTNPLLAVTAQLLDLASSRVTATQVMDFCSSEPVRRRFGFDESSLGRIERWVAGTDVRWGLDADHRAAWQLGRLHSSTWRWGLDRLLLGAAMAEDSGAFAGVLPYDDVGSDEIELLGRFAEFVDRLGSVLHGLSGLKPVEAWATTLADGTAKLACAASGHEWQADELARALRDVVTPSELARLSRKSPDGPLIDAAEARTLLADRLRGRPTRANFRTGELTICTLVPMRSVPHRVVCLLGLDDGSFPRAREQDGDNLLLASPHIGEPDASSEDRQLLLDALLAATEYLIITYEGRDQHLNRKRPPCVPVAELLDVVDQTAHHDEPSRPARDAVMFEHPLQPFDPVNYLPGRITSIYEEPWRFDELHLAGARSWVEQKSPTRPRPFVDPKLPPIRSNSVQLSSLVRWLEHPVRAFLRERLGFYAEGLPEQLSDATPVELTPLQRWALGDRLLTARLQGHELEEVCALERARGLLPPGAAGDLALESAVRIVEVLVAAARGLGSFGAPGVPLDIDLALPDGRVLVGTVPDVRDGTIFRCVYSKLGAKHRLRAWAQFLALSAQRPDLAPRAITIGQSEGSRRDSPRTSTQLLGPPSGQVDGQVGAPLGAQAGDMPTRALSLLSELVQLYDRGMTEPLPIYCATSAAWAEALLGSASGDSPRQRASTKWRSGPDDDMGECADPEHLLVLGGAMDFDEMLEASGLEDGASESRFSKLAKALWCPVLPYETLRER